MESMFKPECERSIVVLCASQDEANKAAENFKEKDYVFVSSENDKQKEREVDFSILEGRKVLVWGEGKEDICIKLKNTYWNLHFY